VGVVAQLEAFCYTGGMQKLVSQFQLMMACQSRQAKRIVDFSDKEAGLYISGHRNNFGTTLMARGPRAELEALVNDV
jgi:hypothetical protein